MTLQFPIQSTETLCLQPFELRRRIWQRLPDIKDLLVLLSELAHLTTFAPHCMRSIDGAYCDMSNVAWSVCLCVCLCFGHTDVQRKMAEAIEIPVDTADSRGPRNHVLDGVEMGWDSIWGLSGPFKSIVTH